jgi:predicted DNA-binding protein (MmcQ/YjbR family)
MFKYFTVHKNIIMIKNHWNTVIVDDSVPDKLLKEWIDHSYWLVVSQLPKKMRLKIENEMTKP